MIDSKIQKINISGYLFNIIACINTFLTLNTDKGKVYLLINFISFPLSFKLSQTILDWRINSITNSLKYSDLVYDKYKNKQKDLEETQYHINTKLDLFLRNLFYQTRTNFDEYVNSYYSIFLENIIVSHKENCPQLPFCFCAKELKTRCEYEPKEQRTQYLYQYIEKAYSNKVIKCKKSKLNELTFSYLMFVIEIMKNETKSLSLALNILQNSKIGLRQEQRLRQIIMYINHKVEVFNMHQNNQNSQHNKSQLDFYNSISYDNNLSIAFSLLQECFYLKKTALQQIGQNHLKIQELINIFTKLRKKRSQLYDYLSTLSQININSGFLMKIIDLFENSIYFQNSITKKINHRIRFQQKQILSSSLLSNYTEDSCVIFITLLKDIGTIKRVTKNIFQVVPIYKSHEAIGKNISYMQPKEIASVHDKILTNFITKQNVSFQIKDYSLLIGVDKYGWAIPYEMKLQTCVIGTTDFGACTWVKQIKDTCFYFMTKYQNNYNLSTVSFQLYKMLFQHIIPQQRILKVGIGSLMPSLDSFIKIQCPKDIFRYRTIIVKPKSEAFCSKQDNFVQSDNLILDLLKFEIYKIEADFFPFHHKYVSFLQVKVYQIEKIYDMKEKFEALQNLLSDFEIFQQYESKFIQEQRNILLKFSQISTLSDNYDNIQFHEIKEKDISYNDTSFPFQQNPSVQNNLPSKRNSMLSIKNDLPSCKEIVRLERDEDNSQQKFQQQKYNQDENNLLDLNSNNIIDQLSPRETDINTQRQILPFSPLSQQSEQIFTPLHSQQLLSQQQITNTQIPLEPLSADLIAGEIDENNQKKFNFSKQNSINRRQSIKYNSSRYIKNQKTSQFNINSTQQLTSYKIIELTSRESHIVKERKVEHSRKKKYNESMNSSSNSKLSHQNQEIINYLQQANKIYGLEIIKYLGFITLLAMIILNIVSFQSLQKYLIQQKEEYEYTDWGVNMNLITSQIAGDASFVKLINLINFKLPNQEEQIEFLNDLNLFQTQRKSLFKELMLTYHNSKVTEGIQIFKEVNSQQINFNFAFSLQDLEVRQIPFFYALTQVYAYEYKVSNQLDVLNQQYYQLLVNEIQILQKLDNLETDIINLVQQVFKNIRDSLFNSQLSDLTTSMVFSLSFLPIFVYVQFKRQQLIGLLATFSPEKIKQMLEQTLVQERQLELIGINEVNSMEQQNKLEKIENRISNLNSFSIQKNKNISSISKLPIFQFKTLIYAIFFIIFNIIYSFSIGITMNSFLSDQENNSEFLSKIQIQKREFYFNFNNQIDQVNRIHTLTVSLVEMEIILIDSRFEHGIQIYENYLQALIEKSQQIQGALNEFYDIMSRQEKINRYKKTEFQKFTKQIMESDICNFLNENQQYLSIKGFKYDRCNSFKRNIFSKGFIVTTKLFLDTITSNLNLVKAQDEITFLVNVVDIFSEYSIPEQFYFKIYYSFAVDVIQGFIKTITYEQYDQIIAQNILFICLQVFTFLSSIYLIYLRFFNSCFEKIIETKRLLDVIDINYLNENQYINSYLKANK